MKRFKHVWALGFASAGVILMRVQDTLAVMLHLPPDAGPYIMIGLGFALVLVAVAPYFFS